MINFWNERFGTDEYAYGISPNEFYKNQLNKIQPGKILFPAEGEGRNAVYAATQSWQVTAFDPSIEGKRKAEKLAKQNGVEINYHIDNYDSIDFLQESFDCLVLIFAHMHPKKRKEYHNKLISFLKPGGLLILEGFSKKQINNDTGGPRDIDMLFSKEELNSDFNTLSSVHIIENDVILDEGPFHQGTASVIRIIGTK